MTGRRTVRKSRLCVTRAELAASIASLMGRDAGASVRYGARFDARPQRAAIPDGVWHPATHLTDYSVTRRGTSSENLRGSAEDRRRRKRYLLDTYGDGHTTRCAFCKCELTYDTVTVDRYPIPGKLGGRYTRDNIRPACGPCNSEDQGRQAALELTGAAR